MAEKTKSKAFLGIVRASEDHRRNGYFHETVENLAKALEDADKAGLTLEEQAEANKIGDFKGEEI